MTRGQLAIITPKGEILTSDEFNGDMYFEGNGQDAYERLDNIGNVAEYENMLRKFNDDFYQYEEGVKAYKCDNCFLDMSNNYIDKWFSDYVYIKNLSDENLTMKDAKGKEIPLNAGTTAVFHYGKFVADSIQDFETWALPNKQKNDSNEAIM